MLQQHMTCQACGGGSLFEAACSERFGLTSLAMVVMKAGGRAVAMRERAWRAERAESAGGLRGKPMVILWTERERERVAEVLFKCQKMFKKKKKSKTDK